MNPELFSKLNEYLQAEQETREKIRTIVRDLETEVKDGFQMIESIHQDYTSTSNICYAIRTTKFEVWKKYYLQIAEVIGDEQHRYNDHWTFITVRIVHIIALIIYLESQTLVPFETVNEIIGVNEDGKKLNIEIESYLQGILQMVNETLVRFAVNAVCAGEYSYVQNIHAFIVNIDKGFRLLNLKNDGLRKRFDCLKYDVKKVESIIYDLSIRGLITTAATN